MKPIGFITCLSAIILMFVFQGLKTVNYVDKTINDNLIQQRATVENIGFVFDWYGLTVVDNIIKFSYGMQSRESLKDTLINKREEKNRLLEEYFKTITPGETELAQLIKENDIKIDLFIDKVLVTNEIERNNYFIIKEMYSLTDPTVSAINEILLIKTSVAKENAANIRQSLDKFKNFLYSAAALCFVINLSYFFGKKSLF